MKIIPISQGKVTIVDDDVYELIKYHTVYYCLGYARINLPSPEKGVYPKHLLHRYIMGFPTSYIDHINGDKLDNRRENLRLADASQNKANCGIRKNNTLGYKGVCFMKGRSKPYMARIKVDYKNKYLGYYATVEEAAEAYNKAAIEVFGEYAKLNVVDRAE